MSRTSRCIALMFLVGLLAVAVSACGGGGSSDPESAVASASEHRDQLAGELMLAEVELEQAFLRQDEMEAVEKPRRAAAGIARVLRSAHQIQRECREGDGLESCAEIDAIEGVVKEIEAEARVGPGH